MRTLVGPGLVVALALVSGCTYVTQGDLEAKRACIDIDGDGAPQSLGEGVTCDESLEEAGLDTLEVDCDETSADRAPHFEEIPYDGIDNDCDGNDQDILDVDRDGFPGISREDYEALGGLPWPSGLTETVDCNDNDDTIFPESPFEFPYDGVDSDCAGDEDYDVDGDGYVPTLNPNNGLPHDPPYAGLLPNGDCDDANPDANPGVVAIDVPYDGVDINCDCANDFDADEDGYMWDQATYETAFLTFKDRYQCTFTVEQWGDCDDSAAAIYPGASDAWYDGTDSDCEGDDDYDQDGDGFIPDGYSLVYQGTLPAGDCLDTNDAIFPTALELIGDSTDQDCDGGSDTASFAFAEADWVNPRGPRVGWTGEHYVLAVGAEQWTDRSTGTPQIQDWPGLLFSFPPAADNNTEIEGRQTWNGSGGNDDPLGEVMDMVTDPSQTRVFLAVSMRRAVISGDNTYLALRAFHWSGSVYNAQSPVLQSVASSDLANDIDLVLSDTGSLFAGSCGTPHLQYVHASYRTGSFARETVGGTSSAGGSACLLEVDHSDDANTLLHVQGTLSPDPKPYLLRDSSGVAFVDQDPLDDQIGPYEDMVFGLVNQDGDLISVYDTASGNTTVQGPTFEETVFTNTVVYDIAAAEDSSGDLYVLAVTEDKGTDGLNDLVLFYGTPGATLTRVDIPVDNGTGTVEPHGASIHVDDDRMFIAVAMRDTATSGQVDDLGWSFLGFAP